MYALLFYSRLIKSKSSVKCLTSDFSRSVSQQSKIILKQMCPFLSQMNLKNIDGSKPCVLHLGLERFI